jgi:ParB family chromosome partitioning protein
MDDFLQRFIGDTLERIEQFGRCGEASGLGNPVPENSEEISTFAQSLERTALFLGATGLAGAARALCGALARIDVQADGERGAAREDLRVKLDQVAVELQALSGLQWGQYSGSEEEPEAASPPPQASDAISAPPVGGDVRPVRLAISDIRIGERLRRLNDAKVAMLESSMGEIGLQTPITVAADEAGGWRLVAGLHRLEATRRLGQSDIACFVIDRSAPAARLWEIDENLVRSELTQLERDQHLLRRKQIFDEWVVGETGRIAPGLGGRGNKGFATDTEEKTGIAKRRVNESVRRATLISDEVQHVVSRMPAADVRVELDVLASLDHEQQKQALEKVERGEAVNFRAARGQLRGDRESDDTQRHLKELRSAWRNAGAEAKARFLRWLQQTAKAEVVNLLRWSESHPPDRSREDRNGAAMDTPTGRPRLNITFIGAGGDGATRNAS